MKTIKIEYGNTTLIATKRIKDLIKKVNQYVITESDGEAWIDDHLLEILEKGQWRFDDGSFTEDELFDIFSDLFWNEAIDYVRYLNEEGR